MGRRRKMRMVDSMPVAAFYRPHGVPMSELVGVALPVEGAEALRLVDAEGMSQEDAAARMEVSTPTLCRILAQARRTVARALTGGLALRIEGGDYRLRGQEPPHGEPGSGGGRGGGRGRGRGPGRGGGFNR